MNKREKKFIETVWSYYRKEGRHDLPWRKTKNAYRILVSEIMLQQTQVERVIPKYKSFLKKFPSFPSLARAPLGDVLRQWQGLGYNRRAKMLHECAKIITENRRGQTPTMYKELMKLPGVGPYTAGAVMAFAYNEAIPIIETNIRTVFIHHFFKDTDGVTDMEFFRLIERSLDVVNPHEWYYALMDYGAFLKKTIGNQNMRSKHYTKQSTFKNSDRHIRGAVIKTLSTQGMTRKSLRLELAFDAQRIDEQVEQLMREGMIVLVGKKYCLP